MQEACEIDLSNEIEWRRHMLEEMKGIKNDFRELRSEVTEVKNSMSWMKLKVVGLGSVMGTVAAYIKTKVGG